MRVLSTCVGVGGVCRYGRSKMDEVFRQDAKEREITLSDFLLQVPHLCT